MCDSAFAIAAASSAIQIQQQRENQRKVSNFQSRQFRRQQEHAAQAARDEYAALQERQAQARQAAGQEALEASRQVEQALGQSGAYAAEGFLTSDLNNQIALQAAEDAAIRARNLQWEDAQILRSMDAARAQQQNRELAALGGPVQGPDYAGILANLAAEGVESYRATLKGPKDRLTNTYGNE